MDYYVFYLGVHLVMHGYISSYVMFYYASSNFDTFNNIDFIA